MVRALFKVGVRVRVLVGIWRWTVTNVEESNSLIKVMGLEYGLVLGLVLYFLG